MRRAESQTGPTSTAEAIAGRGHLHDLFTCEQSGNDWHEAALQLTLAIAATPSPRVRALMKQDLEDLLEKRRSPGQSKNEYT